MRICLILAASLSLAAIACETESTGSMDQDPPISAKHDCVPYSGEPASGNSVDFWNAPNTSVGFRITVPDDRGGGYAEYTVAGDNGSEPSVTITYSGAAAGGAISAGSSADTSTPGVRVGGFAAAAGKTYNFDVDDFFNCTSYPCLVSFGWTYRALVDCYEPNDVRDDAKQIPINEPISAYMVGGHTSNGYRAEPLEDWYKVVLEKDSELSIELINSPHDIRMWFQVFDDSGSLVAGDSASSPGQTIGAKAGFLPAGSYDVVVGAVNITGEWQQGAPIPDAFLQKYILLAHAKPDPDELACEQVAPVNLVQPVAATFDDANDSFTFEEVAQFDGSGFVQFNMGGTIKPRLVVEAAGEVISTAEPINGLVSLYFEAKRGVNYTYRVEQAEAAPAYPAAFVGLYVLRNRNDCFEPNDELAQAKEIIENEPVLAYFIAGHEGTAPDTSDYADWYTFDVPLKSAFTMRVHDLPPTVATRIRLYNEAGDQIREITPATVESVSWGEFVAGRYHISFEPITIFSAAAGVGPDIPPHFNLPYSFTMETEAI